EELPVDGADLVAGGVLAVVEVLDGKAVVGAAVPAGKEALDDLACHQFHVADARQPLGIEVAGAHRWSSAGPPALIGSRTTSKSFSTMWSAVTPSLSARKLVARRWRITGRAT